MNDFSELFGFLNEDEANLRASTSKIVEVHSFLKGVAISVADGKKLSGRDLSTFADLVRAVSPRLELKYHASQLVWDWKESSQTKVDPSVRAIRLMEDLLLNHDSSRIKQCAGEGCELLFFDQSKNRSRRWCEMNHCGMLLKSRNYYARHRKRN